MRLHPAATLRPARNGVLALMLVVAAVTAAACGGSNITPQTAAQANAAANGIQLAQGAGAAAGGTLPDRTTDAGSAPDAAGSASTTSTTSAGTTSTSATGDAGAATSGTTGSVTAAPGSTSSRSGDDPTGTAVKARSCAGLKNQTGITATTITIGNAADVSGPVPGLFKGAQEATKAYVTYFNATHPDGLCGRKVVLDTYDSRTDSGADQQAYTAMCSKDFAAVGSLSVSDNGGVGAAEGCKLADLNAISLTTERNRCSVCFAAEPAGEKEGINAVPDFLLKHERAATQKASIVWLNTGAAAQKAKEYLELNQKRGWKYVYSSSIDVAEFNYGPYVEKMKSNGARLVQLVGAYQQTVRLAQAMQNANYEPDLFLSDPSVYDPAFAQSGGASVDGVVISINFTPFEESQPELDLYKQWLQQSSPGAVPSYFGMYAWSAAKLFAESALELGGGLTRASLLDKLATVHRWTGGGMHAAMDVGGKHAPDCVRFLQLHGSAWQPFQGTSYVCDGLSGL